MTPVPIDLPIRPSEASALAELVLLHLEQRRLTGDARNRLAGEASTLNFTSIRPCFGSLEADPVHQSVYYLAVDGLAQQEPQPLLLRLAPASSPASALFPQAVLIGRMRPAAGREIVVSAAPFGSGDHATILTFVDKVGRIFRPRPQGSFAAISVGNCHPEISLPAAFQAYRVILRETGLNLASTAQLSAEEASVDEAPGLRDGEDPLAPGHTRVSLRSLYVAGLWAAIRTGWREGYTAQVSGIGIRGEDPDEIGRSLEQGKEVIRQAAAFTRFTIDTSGVMVDQADVRHPDASTPDVVRARFQQIFGEAEQKWILGEFGAGLNAGEQCFRFSRDEIERLAVKFGQGLRAAEELTESIRSVKSAHAGTRSFDLELSLAGARALTTPDDLVFCLHWLKSRGCPAQLAAPNLGFKKRLPYPEKVTGPAGLAAYAAGHPWGDLCEQVEQRFNGSPLAELGARVRNLTILARHYNATLSIHSGSGKQGAVLDEIGRATSGRFDYRISGELQLQLFDVLANQPAESPWRRLYLSMVRCANRLALKGAFGPDSHLAEVDSRPCLGQVSRGRVDGNRFLVMWLGHIVGSKDDDGIFFKEKLDRLPADLVAEAQLRHVRYITWLARHLR